jgi:hypothetical protein
LKKLAVDEVETQLGLGLILDRPEIRSSAATPDEVKVRDGCVTMVAATAAEIRVTTVTRRDCDGDQVAATTDKIEVATVTRLGPQRRSRKGL